MWNLKLMVTPVIIRATGIVIKGLKKNLEANQENIQQIHHKRHVISHVVQKVL